MKIGKHIGRFGALGALTLLATTGYMRPAAAETINCIEINSAPTVISSQGVYCLKKHLPVNLSSGSAITVTVNNVTIDCNEFKLGNLASGPSTQAFGITAVGRTNVRVRNCGIRGFLRGVSLTNGEYRVEDNEFDSNTQDAIHVTGSGSSIRKNEIVATGGSTLGGVDEFRGIFAGGGGMDILDNNVAGVVATAGTGGDVYGIYLEGIDAGTVRDNRVRELAPDGSGFRRGIWVDSGDRVSVKGNSVVLNGGLLSLDAGIRCGNGLILNGIAQDNSVLGTGLLGTALGLVNCTSVGGLNYVNPL